MLSVNMVVSTVDLVWFASKLSEAPPRVLIRERVLLQLPLPTSLNNPLMLCPKVHSPRPPLHGNAPMVGTNLLTRRVLPSCLSVLIQRWELIRPPMVPTRWLELWVSLWERPLRTVMAGGVFSALSNTPVVLEPPLSCSPALLLPNRWSQML